MKALIIFPFADITPFFRLVINAFPALSKLACVNTLIIARII